MNIEEYFSKQNIINNLSSYEMYYQVSLASLINSTKVDDINYEIEFQLALGSIYELLKDLENEKNLDEIFEKELQKQSAMDAVQNFVNENLEFVKQGKIDIEPIVNSINDETFFNKTLLEVCEINKQSQLKKWEELITDELAQAIMSSLKDLENNG